jgi:hypothetical protein
VQSDRNVTRFDSLPSFLLILFSASLPVAFPQAHIVFFLSKYSVAVPLAIACAALVITIPAAAARARLHIPGYVGLAFLSFALALLLGWFSGAQAIAGTSTGLLLSIVFFLLIAAAIGSVVALLFYRHPPET